MSGIYTVARRNTKREVDEGQLDSPTSIVIGVESDSEANWKVEVIEKDK